MGIREDRSYIQSRRAEREALKEASEKQMRDNFNATMIERDNVRAKHESALNNFYAFKDDIKKVLIKKALMELCLGSLHNPSKREAVICENLIDQYVTEVGTAKLLRNMKFSESGFLHVVAEKTDKFYKEIADEASADNPESQVIPKEDIESFWKEVDKANDVEDITNLIRIRVSNAEEEFVNKNQNDKEDVKTVLKQTAARVQNAKAMNDNDYAETVEESETRLAKNKIYQIQHESNRNVFDRMVRNLSEVALTNEDAKATFTDKAGRLDLDKIVESARCMYTLLETVATIQLEKVDQQYIEDSLKSII